MLQLRRTFIVLEKFGVLRYVARYVRHETGRSRSTSSRACSTAAQADPDRWPLISFAVGDLSRFMVPPVSWKLFLAEVRRYVVEELGVADDDALDHRPRGAGGAAARRAAGVPADTRQLAHDFAAWHDAMLDAKYDGHLGDWPDVVPHLRTYGPGSLTVEDPRNVSLYELGVNIEEDPFDSWDLHSPVSRAVAAQG